HLDHLSLGLARDVDAAARHRTHETLALELRHRLAHRGAADAELLRELALVEPDVIAAAIDVHRHDDVLQRLVGLVLEAERGVDRLDRKAGIVRIHGFGMRNHATQGTVTTHRGIQYSRALSGTIPALSA